MKKDTQSRKCNRCRKVIFRIVPDKAILGLGTSTTETVRPFRYVKENADGSGHYYCLDCIRDLSPGKN